MKFWICVEGICNLYFFYPKNWTTCYLMIYLFICQQNKYSHVLKYENVYPYLVQKMYFRVLLKSIKHPHLFDGGRTHSSNCKYQIQCLHESGFLPFLSLSVCPYRRSTSLQQKNIGASVKLSSGGKYVYQRPAQSNTVIFSTHRQHSLSPAQCRNWPPWTITVTTLSHCEVTNIILVDRDHQASHTKQNKTKTIYLFHYNCNATQRNICLSTVFSSSKTQTKTKGWSFRQHLLFSSSRRPHWP